MGALFPGSGYPDDDEKRREQLNRGPGKDKAKKRGMIKEQERLKAELGQEGWEDCGIWLAKRAYEGNMSFVISHLRLWRNRTSGRMIFESVPEGTMILQEPIGALVELAIDRPPMEVGEVLKAVSDLLGWGRFFI